MRYLLTFLVLATGHCLSAQSIDLDGATTRAVVVGISDYQDKDIPDLRFADRDAEAFANFLRSPAGGSLDGDHLKVLIDSQATVAQFAIALDWLMEVTKEGDEAIIYFSGHGDVEKKTLTQPGFLLCWDAPSRVYMAGGAFNLRDVQEIVSTLSIQNKAKVVVITDACRSGTLAGQTVGGAQATAANLAKQYANEIKILSCQPNEYSIEGEQWGGGRGAFSFNLVDALYGMADGNGDLSVNLREVGRYLEDHVAAEVAPVSQNPKVVGDPNERLASVDARLLADLRSGRTSQMKMLYAIESRGMEDDVLASVDTTVREMYRFFKKALKDKAFLEPATACADFYYEKLIVEPGLARLHSTMRRNYAAALQDDAQQAMNIWLRADIKELSCIGKTLRLQPIPQQLERAAELLGESHYMYNALKGRMALFEGIVLQRDHSLGYNPEVGRKSLALFQKSLDYEPNSPIAYFQMMQAYGFSLHNLDSAEWCMNMAHQLAPSWVTPFTNFYFLLRNIGRAKGLNNREKEILDRAIAIDSTHGFVLGQLSTWLVDNKRYDEAIAALKKYEENGGSIYPCWCVYQGYIFQQMQRYEEAEAAYKRSVQLDSTLKYGWLQLGYVYMEMKRFAEAEIALLKAVQIDSTFPTALLNLGFLYTELKEFEKAEAFLEKVVRMNPPNSIIWNSIGFGYNNLRKFEDAESALKKAIELDSVFLNPLINLGYTYTQTRRFDEAELVLKKSLRFDAAQAWTWELLGYTFTKTNRFGEAKTAFEKALSIDSTFVPTIGHMGLLHFRQGNLDLAKTWYQKALSLDAGDASALLGMAYLLHSEGKPAEAIGYVEQAIGKGSTFEQLESDEDLAPLRALPEWGALMKKQFPDQIKD